MAMDVAGHRTERMHNLYTPFDAEEKQAAARSAFGKLRLMAGAVPTDESGEQRRESGDHPGEGDAARAK